MSLYRTSSQRNARSLNQPDAASTRLQGGTLMLARGVWIAGAVAALVIFFASVPPYFTALHTVSASGLNLSGDQLTPEGLRQLLASGLSVDFYAAYLVIINVIFVVAWFVVGSLIFWRKSDDRIAFFASFALM